MQGFSSKEEGLAAQYAAQGLSPKVAAALAKQMSRNVSGNMMAETYKADAVRQLNARAGASIKGNSLMSFMGNNLDLGLVSSLFKFTGAASEAVFGKSGALGAELGLAAAPYIGLAAAGPLALGVGAVSYGMNNASTVGRGLLSKDASNAQRAMVAGGMNFIRNAGAMAAGYAGYGAMGGGLMGTLGAAAPIAAVYAGSKVGTWGASKLLKGMYGRNAMADEHRGVGIAAYSGGAAATTLATLGAMSHFGLALGPWGWAGSALAAGAAGAIMYGQDKYGADLVRDKRLVSGAARSAADLEMLRGTDLYNELQQSYVGAHSGVSAGVAYRKPTMSKRMEAKFSKYMHQATYVSNRVRGTRVSRMFSAASVNNVMQKMTGEDLAASMKSFEISGSSWHGAYVGGVTNPGSRSRMAIISRIYKNGTDSMREAIERAGTDYTSFIGEDGVSYRSPKEYLTKKGRVAINIDSLNTRIDDFNDVYVGADASRLQLGQSSAMAAALNKLATFDSETLSGIASNANSPIIGALAKQYGVDSNKLFNLANGRTGVSADRLKLMASHLGGIGMDNYMYMLGHTTKSTVIDNISADNVTAVSKILGSVTTSGKMTPAQAAMLQKSLAGEASTYASQLKGMVQSRGYLAYQSTQIGGDGISSYEAYKKKFKDHQMTQSMYQQASVDGVLTAQELSNYSASGYTMQRLSQINTDANTVAPKQAIEQLVDNVDKIARNTEIIAGKHKGTPSTKLDDVPTHKGKTTIGKKRSASGGSPSTELQQGK